MPSATLDHTWRPMGSLLKGDPFGGHDAIGSGCRSSTVNSADTFAILVKLPAQETQDCASFHQPKRQGNLPRVAMAQCSDTDESNQ
jgi:hypothetical protein